jgi:hypothetical protein
MVRYNKVIELLEQDKPVFCSGLVWNGNLDDMTFVGDADYDMVIVEMEHQGFSFNDLRTMLQFLMNRKKVSEMGSLQGPSALCTGAAQLPGTQPMDPKTSSGRGSVWVGAAPSG